MVFLKNIYKICIINNLKVFSNKLSNRLKKKSTKSFIHERIYRLNENL